MSWINLLMRRPDGSRAEVSIAEDQVTPDLLIQAELLLRTLQGKPAPGDASAKDLYAACAQAFGTTYEDAKERLLFALYGGKSPIAAQASDDPEMIAQWIEGYGAEPMDSAIIAKAIRAGKWRAS